MLTSSCHWSLESVYHFSHFRTNSWHQRHVGMTRNRITIIWWLEANKIRKKKKENEVLNVKWLDARGGRITDRWSHLIPCILQLMKCIQVSKWAGAVQLLTKISLLFRWALLIGRFFYPTLLTMAFLVDSFVNAYDSIWKLRGTIPTTLNF